MKKVSLSNLPVHFILLTLVLHIVKSADLNGDQGVWVPVVKRDQRTQLVLTEFGEISAVNIGDPTTDGSYHLQFITLAPNSLFLPVLLHADMVFYVHTGSGRLSWTDDDEIRHVQLKGGDIYRLNFGTVFFIESNSEPESKKLRVYALFANSADDLHGPSNGAYTGINDIVLGFDKRTLQATFKVTKDVIEAITSGMKPPAIVDGVLQSKPSIWEFEAEFVKTLIARKRYGLFSLTNKKLKTRVFNVFNEEPDFINCNGWSLIVDKKKLPALRGSKLGAVMLNLTKGSTMGPHWNPMSVEVSIVLQGRGMVRVVCSGTSKQQSECKNTSLKVEEGDVFVVPRFHPMSQTSFNDEDRFAILSFTATTKKNRPQFVVEKVLILDKRVLVAAFGVMNATVDQLLAPRVDEIISECTSCAEEEEREMKEEMEMF